MDEVSIRSGATKPLLSVARRGCFERFAGEQPDDLVLGVDRVRFKRVYLEISNLCNLHCPFCIALERKPGRMSAQRFYEAAKQIRPYSDYLYLHVKGEPL